MTNQVNDTGSGQTELSEEELYDQEWEAEGDSDQAPSAGNSDYTDDSNDSDEPLAEERAGDTGSATSRTAVKGNSSTTKASPSANHSGGKADSDIWEGATDAQRLAFLKAQNDFNSMSGRAKAEQQRRADLEREIENQRTEQARVNRKKGTYETEHPELFDEVNEYLRSSGQVSYKEEPKANTKGDDDIRTVFKVHPDAQELMLQDDWQQYTKALSDTQQRQLESDDPYEFIDLINSFKTHRAVRAATRSANVQDDDLLDESVTRSPGTSSRAPAKGAMSDDEAYEAEWAKDS